MQPAGSTPCSFAKSSRSFGCRSAAFFSCSNAVALDAPRTPVSEMAARPPVRRLGFWRTAAVGASTHTGGERSNLTTKSSDFSSNSALRPSTWSTSNSISHICSFHAPRSSPSSAFCARARASSVWPFAYRIAASSIAGGTSTPEPSSTSMQRIESSGFFGAFFLGGSGALAGSGARDAGACCPTAAAASEPKSRLNPSPPAGAAGGALGAAIDGGPFAAGAWDGGAMDCGAIDCGAMDCGAMDCGAIDCGACEAAAARSS